MDAKIEKNSIKIDVKNTISFLRSKEGCPWDQKQTHNSLKKNLLEESYELLEALESKEPQKIKEELGDLVCQVFFHCEIAEEAGEFSISDVFSILNEKLIRRHPHVFGESKALNAENAHAIWQESKLKENPKRSFLDGIPNSMPELAKAQLFQERTGLQGFDWDNMGYVQYDKNKLTISGNENTGGQNNYYIPLIDMENTTYSVKYEFRIEFDRIE